MQIRQQLARQFLVIQVDDDRNTPLLRQEFTS